MTFEGVLAILLVVGAIVLAVVFISASVSRDLTTLEVIALQVMVLFLTLFGSFIGGRQLAHASADQSLRGHAKSAFRRVVSLYRGLGRVAEIAAEPGVDPKTALAVIEESVRVHMDTVDDALADWRELVPQEIETLHRSISPPWEVDNSD